MKIEELLALEITYLSSASQVNPIVDVGYNINGLREVRNPP